MDEKYIIEKATTYVETRMPAYHSHPFYELYFLADGIRQVYINDNMYELNKNDLIIIPPNTPHKTDKGPFTRYLVSFYKEQISAEQLPLITLCENKKISITKSEVPIILDTIEKLYKLYVNFPISGENVNDFNINLLFQYLIFSISQLENFPKNFYSPASKLSSLTKKVVNYIKEHYREKITLDILSKEFFVSKSVLNKKFRNDTNMSIIEFTLLQRLHTAKLLLMNTNKSISLIADYCGFISQQYFYLMFSKRFGISPSKYRKENQSKIHY